MKPAVFLDKDGTLIEDVPYNVDPDKIRFTDGALEGLRLLQKAGFRLILVSNQSGVARGRFPEIALVPVKSRLCELLEQAGISLDGFYYCPHHPEGMVASYAVACFCRKPQPGLLMHAARLHAIDLPKSWLIGDILNDVEAGNRASCSTILMSNGNETEWQMTALRKPDFMVANLHEAAEIIIGSKE